MDTVGDGNAWEGIRGRSRKLNTCACVDNESRASCRHFEKKGGKGRAGPEAVEG